ncbi:putative adhesin [Microbulbifer sp. JTAC008]|uniref:putative adhesin n=1 Tax=unclassified Microbulbifer TaxID=2619833 RepID=UPI00403A3BF4
MPVREFDLVKIFAAEGTQVGDAPNLVISAHGATTKQIFYPKGHGGDNLFFFSPHGYSLNDPGIGSVLSGNAKYHEWIGKGKVCHNYTLSKYQGYHGSTTGQILGRITRPFIKGESYADVQKAVDNAHEHNEMVRNLDPNNPMHQPYIKKGVKPVMSADLLTIRNRVKMDNPTLVDVLNILHRNNLHYENIYCSFCRSEVSFSNILIGTPSWDSKMQRPTT